MYPWNRWEKKLKGKVIITHYKEGIATALYEDGRPVELSYDMKQQGIAVGNIYIGKVANVVKNIQAAFVEIEDRVPCYYAFEKDAAPIFTGKGKSKDLAAGDELLVQVSREAAKTKGPSVTSALSFSGKYLVLTHGRPGIGFSSKLGRTQRERLRPVIEPLAQKNFGWIVRTNAQEASEEEIIKEAGMLTGRYEKLCAQAMHRPCRTCVSRALPPYLSHIKDYYASDYEEIVTDDSEMYAAIGNYLKEYQPQDIDKLRLYEDRLLPLAKLYSLETAFEHALSERVWLKSGAYLVIQPTEALTVVDVNTGKYDGKKKLQDTFLKINQEAARETARQLRLRNLSGIIIVDFINMESEEAKKQVMQTLSEELRKDPKKAAVIDMTPLGLVEITRKREEKPLFEKFRDS